MAEKKGSGFTPPGVYGNQEKADGKQWGSEARSKRGAAQERETRRHGTGGMKEQEAAVRGGSGEVRPGGESKWVGCDAGVPRRTRQGNEGPRGTRRGVACQGFVGRGPKP